MQQQLVPPEILAKADKILFVTHLAIGDFTYLQNYLAAFARQYPHIKIHLWVDEVRRTRCFWRWKTLKENVLFDWLETCSFIHKLYRETYSPFILKKTIKQAQTENYPIIVSLATLRPVFYARMSRLISLHAFVVGLEKKISKLHFLDRWLYRELDVSLSLSNINRAFSNFHISDEYAQWFECLFGIIVEPAARIPYVHIPRKWITYAKLQFMKYGIDKKTKEFGKVIFINAFAKTTKRCWPLSHVLALVLALKQDDQWGDVSFLINVLPEDYQNVRAFFNQHSVNNLILFTADYNFFQLPAVLSICDLVISVETSVMHLARALDIPVIALMRKKNPEWRPFGALPNSIIWADKWHDWVKDIPVEDVLRVVNDQGKQFLLNGKK